MWYGINYWLKLFNRLQTDWTLMRPTAELWAQKQEKLQTSFSNNNTIPWRTIPYFIYDWEKLIKCSFTYYWHDCKYVVLQVSSVMSNHLGVGRHHELNEARVRQEASLAWMRAAGIIFGMSRTLLHRFLYWHHFLFQSSVAMETDVIVLEMFCRKINKSS